MPFYDYRCSACDHVSEVMQRIGDPAPDTCPACARGPLERLVSAPAIGSSGGSSGGASAGPAGGGHVHGPGCRH